MTSLSRFRKKLAAGECLYGLWISLEAAAVTDIAAALGLDWVVVEGRLGHLDWSDIVEHLRAVKRSHTVALVQLADATASEIDRVMDIGADGLVVRGVKNGEQLRSIVDRVRTAAKRVQTLTGWKHSSDVALPLVVLMIEPHQQNSVLDELLEIENVDVYFFTEHITETMTAMQAGKKHVGLAARSDEELVEYGALGMSMLGLGSDRGIVFDGMCSALASCVSHPQSRGAGD